MYLKVYSGKSRPFPCRWDIIRDNTLGLTLSHFLPCLFNLRYNLYSLYGSGIRGSKLRLINADVTGRGCTYQAINKLKLEFHPGFFEIEHSMINFCLGYCMNYEL